MNNIESFKIQFNKLDYISQKFVLQIFKMLRLYKDVDKIEFNFTISCSQKQGIGNYNFRIDYPDNLNLNPIRGIGFEFDREHVLLLEEWLDE